ncbi:MAG: Lsr2 family protein [Bifidobacteriaceae bacterium]|jgi:hypothetical protein|nr:Lsr2 family protein [Bifidobacteriaceae bacterium]
MAQRVVVELLDDIDQSPATTTVEFGLDGVNYKIDLSQDHAAELRAFLEPYAKAGRPADRKRPNAKESAAGPGFDPAAVRAWADSNAIAVSRRGRVPAWVVQRYHEAGY